ncbi:hypothetical protein OG874_08230 [Nocardia sp. NBC_00565]|nr:hypothetical protein [Nocardia sp. NBC_00565]WUC05123.1 hypothetical protein OG874_08230 [Nocardia sp. NBC_00565]
MRASIFTRRDTGLAAEVRTQVGCALYMVAVGALAMAAGIAYRPGRVRSA